MQLYMYFIHRFLAHIVVYFGDVTARLKGIHRSLESRMPYHVCRGAHVDVGNGDEVVRRRATVEFQ